MPSNLRSKLILSLSFVYLSFSISANASVSIKDTYIYGDGCPKGTTSTIFAPDNQSASFLFDSLVINQNPLATTINSTTKNCVVETNFQANYDEQYTILTQDWRGYVELPSQSKASLTSQVWLFHLEGTSWISDFYKTETKSVIGPASFNWTYSQSTPESTKTTQCGQSFKLKLKVTSTVSNSNHTSNAQMGIDSLDLAQLANSNVVKIPCTNPWNAELVNSSQSGKIDIKITTEIPKINKLGALYVAALYQNKWYFLSPNHATRWVDAETLTSSSYPEIGSGKAPASFQYSITDIYTQAHGAVIYVGVGYGQDATSRTKDLVNTKRFKAVYTVP